MHAHFMLTFNSQYWLLYFQDVTNL